MSNANNDIIKQHSFDRLEDIFRKQQIFTDRVYKNFKNQEFSCYNFNKETFDISYSLQRAMIELSEAIREIDDHTKIWKTNIKEPYDREKILEELIDTSKFIHQAILFLGYNTDDYYDGHMKKDNKNHKRQDQKY